MLKKHLFPLNKYEYIRGERPKVDCILCAIIEKDESVKSLIIYQNELVCISANLYPYNPGHILVFPVRHVKDFRELTTEEEKEINRLTRTSLDKLDELYTPHGYNIGMNIGDASGASINHLHTHIVPRYANEMGFVELSSGAKIFIEPPETTMKRMREAFSDIDK